MGSISFDGVRFAFFSHDHLPVHAHGYYSGVEVVVEIGETYADLARRTRNPKPRNAKRADVAHVLNTAYLNRAALLAIWRSINEIAPRR